jgi:hypothetical protein
MSLRFQPLAFAGLISTTAGEKGEKGETGAKGEKGEKGEAGGGGSNPPGLFKYTYEVGGSETPAKGKFTTNNTNFSLVTKLWINQEDAEGRFFGNWMALLVHGPGGILQLTYPGHQEEVQQFALAAEAYEVVAKATPLTITVTALAKTENAFFTTAEGTLVEILQEGASGWETMLKNGSWGDFLVNEAFVLQTLRIRTEGFSTLARLRGAIQVKAAKTALPGSNLMTIPTATSTHVSMRPMGVVSVVCATATAYEAEVNENTSTLLTAVPKATCEKLTVGTEVIGVGIKPQVFVTAVNAAKEEVTISKAAEVTELKKLAFIVPGGMARFDVTATGTFLTSLSLPEGTIVYLDNITWNLN